MDEWYSGCDWGKDTEWKESKAQGVWQQIPKQDNNKSWEAKTTKSADEVAWTWTSFGQTELIRIGTPDINIDFKNKQNKKKQHSCGSFANKKNCVLSGLSVVASASHVGHRQVLPQWAACSASNTLNSPTTKPTSSVTFKSRKGMVASSRREWGDHRCDWQNRQNIDTLGRIVVTGNPYTHIKTKRRNTRQFLKAPQWLALWMNSFSMVPSTCQKASDWDTLVKLLMQKRKQKPSKSLERGRVGEVVQQGGREVEKEKRTQQVSVDTL